MVWMRFTETTCRMTKEKSLVVDDEENDDDLTAGRVVLEKMMDFASNGEIRVVFMLAAKLAEVHEPVEPVDGLVVMMMKVEK